MKATGIVRRIDDLGRVVIPKEIRRTMRIREGDPLEIYTEKDGEVIFKKYSPIGELGDFAANYVETLAKASGHGACITDRDNVIAVSGLPKKELIEKPVSSELENVMNEKIIVSYKDGKPVSVADGVEKYNAGVTGESFTGSASGISKKVLTSLPSRLILIKLPYQTPFSTNR